MSPHLAWARLAVAVALLLVLGAVFLVAVALGRRRKSFPPARDAWPEMETDLARMEERVENLTTILSDRR